MKKRSLIILFVVLTMVFAFSSTSVCFAEEINQDNQGFTKADTLNLIISYCALGLSLFIGIPLIRAINKRKKQGYVSDLCVDTEKIAEQVMVFYENRTPRTKREIIRYSIKINAVADMALTTYTEKQIAGYYDLYNDLNMLKQRLAEIEKHKNDVNYETDFLDIVTFAKQIANRAKLLKDNEDIVRKYNG